MNGVDMFLVQYGLAAVFVVLLVKSIGICPACLALYTVNQLRPLPVEVRA